MYALVKRALAITCALTRALAVPRTYSLQRPSAAPNSLLTTPLSRATWLRLRRRRAPRARPSARPRGCHPLLLSRFRPAPQPLVKRRRHLTRVLALRQWQVQSTQRTVWILIERLKAEVPLAGGVLRRAFEQEGCLVCPIASPQIPSRFMRCLCRDCSGHRTSKKPSTRRAHSNCLLLCKGRHSADLRQ